MQDVAVDEHGHELERLRRSAEVGPPLLQGLAALLGGFSLSFAGDFYVPSWLFLVVVPLTIAIVVGSAVWSWQVRKAIYRRDVSQTGRWRATTTRTWIAVAALSTLLLIAAVTPTIYLGLRASPDFLSPYDGRDPNESGCGQSIDTRYSDQAVPLLNDKGAPLGQILLRRSTRCSTIWTRFRLIPESAAAYNGGDVQITMVRDGDGQRTQLRVHLDDSADGFGDMLSDGQACVRTEVTILTSGGDPVSDTARTGCHP